MIHLQNSFLSASSISSTSLRTYVTHVATVM